MGHQIDTCFIPFKKFKNTLKIENWDSLIERMNKGILYGEFYLTMNHYLEYYSSGVSFESVSHYVTHLEKKSDGIYGKVNVLESPAGKVLKTYIDNGIKIVFRPAAKFNNSDNLMSISKFFAIPKTNDPILNRNNRVYLTI